MVIELVKSYHTVHYKTSNVYSAITWLEDHGFEVTDKIKNQLTKAFDSEMIYIVFKDERQYQ